MDFLLGFMARKLLLLRHGETGEAYLNRYVGSTDFPLSERGRRQAGVMKMFLHDRVFDHCLCSPMARCMETAAAVLESREIRMEIDHNLREIDFGQWEGMSFDEIAKSSPDLVRRWGAFDPVFAFPGGESIGDFLERVRFVAERLSHDPADTILLCTHGGIIRTMICHFLKLEPWQYILFTVKPASVTTIELYDSGGILTGLSETGQIHLTEGRR
ncbi:MAG: histidine phosphatase family protein [Deltaproteobacteria bacterium]